jgi:hypothetical protein
MDNFDLDNFDDKIPAPSQEGMTIPFDDSDPPATAPPVSRKPLTLGGNGLPRPQGTPKPAPTQPSGPGPVQRPASAQAQAGAVAKKVAQAVNGASRRIAAVKTFYTKLHPGALDFLDEQIADWLKANPTVVIKQTNVTVGEVQAKKTEPNLIVCLWY